MVPIANDRVVRRLDVEFGVDATVDDKLVEGHVCVPLAECGEGSLNASQLWAGLSTGSMEFAVHRWAVFQERGEAPAGRYGAVLGGITGQDELGPGVACKRGEAREIEGSDRAGLIHHQDAPGTDDRFIGCGAVGSGEHCGDGVAGDAGAAFEVLSGRSLYGGTEDAVAGGLPCSGGDSECEGLAGTGGSNEALELVAVRQSFCIACRWSVPSAGSVSIASLMVSGGTTAIWAWMPSRKRCRMLDSARSIVWVVYRGPAAASFVGGAVLRLGPFGAG